MRHTYELSELTKEALEGHIKAIADELDVTPRYLHSILAGAETDPYARLRPFFRAIARKRPDKAALFIEDLKSLIPTEVKKNGYSNGVEEAFDEVIAACSVLFDARNRGRDRRELNALAVKLSAHTNNLMQVLDPPAPMVIGDRKRA